MFNRISKYELKYHVKSKEREDLQINRLPINNIRYHRHQQEIFRI